MKDTVLALPRFGWNILQHTAAWVVYLHQRFVRQFKNRIFDILKRSLPWFLAIGAGGLLAKMIMVLSPAQVIATFLSLVLAIIFVLKPEYSVITIILATSTIASVKAIPKPIAVGGQGFGATELLILFMLPVLFIRIHADPKVKYTHSPIAVPLFMLYLAILVAMGVTIHQHAVNPTGPWPFEQLYGYARPMFHYLFFFIVMYSLDTKEKLRMVLRTVVWAAVIVAIMIVIQYFLGTRHWIFIGSPYDSGILYQEYENREIARPMPPGVPLVLTAFVLAAGASTYRRLRDGSLNFTVALILGVGMVFTYTRGNWISSFVSIMIIWFAVNRTAKARLGVAFASSVACIVLFSLSVGQMAPGSAGYKFSENIRARFMSIFTKDTLLADGIQNRIHENRYAIQQIRKSPIFGIGAGNPVGYAYSRDQLGSYHITEKERLHNGYLELYMSYGLFGVISFLWLTIVFFVRGIYIYRNLKDPEAKALVISLMAAYVGFLMRYSHTMALLVEVFNITVTAMIWGLLEVVWRVYQNPRESKNEPSRYYQHINR